MTRYFSRRRVILYLLLYVLVIFYTLTFPTTVAWFLFYSFTLLIVLAYVTSRSTVVVTRVHSTLAQANQLTVHLTLSSKTWLPLFWPNMTVRLSKNNQNRHISQSVLLRKNVHLSFQPILLNRGHHDSIDLTVESTGLFGLYSRWFSQTLPIDVAVYPALMTKSDRASLIKDLSTLLSQSTYSSLHEFYVKEIRNYQNRDSLSAIDWKSSMRRGQWMVKDYENEEEAPFAVVFYGYKSSQFESLLSVAYNLYNELQALASCDLLLLGQFDTIPSFGETPSSFLSIEASSDNQQLSTLFNNKVPLDKRLFIITPDSHLLPTHTILTSQYYIIDESRLNSLKGV